MRRFSRHNLYMLATLGALGIAACAQLGTKVVDPLLRDISRINQTAQADLLRAQAIAQAATPPDQDGFACAGAALQVSKQVDAVNAAARGTDPSAPAGPLALAELASLFQPGSAQYETAKQTLTSGCAAKAQDVLGAAGLLAAGGVIGALGVGQGILPLAAAAP